MFHKLGWVAATIAGGVLLLLSGATAAPADVVTFTLENVTFDAESTATGSFSLDPKSLVVSNVNITTTAFTTTSGTIIPGAMYIGNIGSLTPDAGNSLFEFSLLNRELFFDSARCSAI
jgi:hypothetical protein